MKHLKLFQTEPEYNSFKGSSDFVLPNVSYVVVENLINYAPAPSIITFYIDGSPMNALKGMTWAEYINSEYNLYNLTIYEEYIISTSMNMFVCINDHGNLNKVKATDVITPEGSHYYYGMVE